MNDIALLEQIRLLVIQLENDKLAVELLKPINDVLYPAETTNILEP